MKIAVVTEKVARNDGQGRVAYETVRLALAQGHSVTLLADQVDEDLMQAGARWVPVHAKTRRIALLKGWEATRRADRALDVLAKHGERFDIIQGFGGTVTRPHQVNVAQFVHDAWRRSPAHTFRAQRTPYGLYQWVYTVANTRWERQSFRRAQVVVACSHLVREELLTVGVSSDQVRVILNAADPLEFHPGAFDRAALGLPVDVPLALFAGDIRTPRKNLDTVLRSLVGVSGLHLAVVGAREGSPYPDMAARLGVGERVRFLGFRRDMAALMRAVDVFVFPSRYEPFGIVVLEAMASGIPVVIAATVGAAEVVTPECGVVLPDPEDATEMTCHLNRLVGDAALRHSLGQAARVVAETQTWDGMAEKYLRLYEEIVSCP